MKSLIDRADPRIKDNYNYFKLMLEDKDEFQRKRDSLKNIKHPQDPFYNPKIFKTVHHSVYDTN